MLALSGPALIYAQEIKLTGISPAPGSEINSFEFTLSFDLSAVPKAHGNGEYGIGYASGGNVSLYKGDPENGILLGTALTTSYTALLPKFEPTTKISFSIQDFAPQEGITYTLVISKIFNTYKKGEKSTTFSDPLDYFNNEPLTYTFKGGNDPDPEVMLTEPYTPKRYDRFEQFGTAVFKFNRPVTYNSSRPVTLTFDGAEFAPYKEVIISDDGLTATIVYDSITLFASNYYYKLTVPEGAFVSREDSRYSYAGVTIDIKGGKIRRFGEITNISAEWLQRIFRQDTG